MPKVGSQTRSLPRRRWPGRFRSWFFRWRRPVLTGLVALVAPIPVAFLGLWFQIAVASRFWLCAGAGFLALLIGLAVWRDSLDARAGTLYYVRYLDPWMADWHDGDMRAQMKEHLDVRIVTRTATRDWPLEAHKVDDVATDLETLSQDLQSTMNGDLSTTSFHLAPNLLMPAALSLGHELFNWDSLVLDELMNAGSIHWTLRDTARHGSVEHRINASDNNSLTQEESQPLQGAAMVVADLTTEEASGWPTAYKVGRRHRVAVFRSAGPDLDAERCSVRVDPQPDGRDASSGYAVVAPMSAAEMCAAALRIAIHETADDGVVFVVLRVPKTVAVAIGHLLRTIPCRMSTMDAGREILCLHSACRNPWSVLVPLNYERDYRRYTPMRVHPLQPPVEVMETRLRGYLA